MRRLIRILIRSFTVVSLLLCVATCVVWVWSFESTKTLIRRHRGATEQHFGVERGTVRVGEGTGLKIPPEATTLDWVRAGPITHWEWAGFGFAWGESVPYVDLGAIGNPSFVHVYERVRMLACPAWAMVALTAILPGIWVRRHARDWRTRRNLNHGRCPACGYNLRATPERCPECGAAPPAKATV